MKNERDVKAEVKKILNATPKCWWFMPVMSGYGQQGIPDFIVCLAGKFIAIETKFGKNTLSEWQTTQITRIHEAEGIVWVISEASLPTLAPLLEAVLGLEEE